MNEDCSLNLSEPGALATWLIFEHHRLVIHFIKIKETPKWQ